jgi:hypothetical protein
VDKGGLQGRAGQGSAWSRAWLQARLGRGRYLALRSMESEVRLQSRAWRYTGARQEPGDDSEEVHGGAFSRA